jgi:FAD/FMN-containing dehydrogenase
VSEFSYQNYLNLNMSDVFRAAYYGDNFARLKKVKAQLDPNNVFGNFAFAI